MRERLLTLPPGVSVWLRWILAFALLHGFSNESYVPCDKFVRDSVPFNLEECALELLNAANGVTSSRRGEVLDRGTRVFVWSSHVSPAKDKVFAIILESQPNPKSNPAYRARPGNTILYCFSVVFTRQSDGAWLGHILQYVYFADYSIEDSLRLQQGVCNAYFGHNSERSGYCLSTGKQLSPDDRKVLNPHDSAFYTDSPIWADVERGLKSGETFRFVGDSTRLRLVRH